MLMISFGDKNNGDDNKDGELMTVRMIKMMKMKIARTAK